MPEFEFRALRRDDVPALYEMLLAVEQADDRDLVQTLEDLQREFDDPWSNAEVDSLAAFTLDGQLAGYARTFQNPQPERRSALSPGGRGSSDAAGQRTGRRAVGLGRRARAAACDAGVQRGRARAALQHSGYPD